MKNILIQINNRDNNAGWFQMLYAQLSKNYNVGVIGVDDYNGGKRSLLIDISLKTESFYKLAGHISNSNRFVEIQNNLDVSQFDLALNLSATDLICYSRPVIDLYYRGQRLLASSYVGLYEHLDKEATINIDVVLSLGTKLLLVEQARYRGHWSILKNKALIYYSLPSLLQKVISKLDSGYIIQQKYTASKYHDEIDLLTSSKYFYSSLRNINKKLYNSLCNKLFHDSGGQEWTIFIGSGSFLSADTTQLIPAVFPDGEFWADPFLFNYNGDLWLFFERFPYKTNKGIISCTKILDGKPTEIVDVLDKPYHLSYPNIFEEDGQIFMIPECSAAKRIEVYRCLSFPDKWELYSTAFEGESFADSVYFKDDHGDRWLFSSKESPIVVSHCNELWAYRIDSLKFKRIESHKQNPIIINASVARNGGTIYRENGKIYRASQDNSFEMYGKGVCINEITDLSLDRYSEKTIKRIDIKDIPGTIGMHHMDQIDGYFVIDGRLK